MSILNSPEFWERPISPRGLVGLTVIALVALVVVFEMAVRPIESLVGSDVNEYATYGSKMFDGDVPYRDFRMEYPPGASLMFLLPATPLAGGAAREIQWDPPNAAARRYYRSFTSLVLALLAAIVLFTALALSALRRPVWMVALALAVVVCSPLLIGRVLTERFDVLPAAATSAALAVAMRGGYRLGGVLIGLGAAVKIYPGLLLPVLAVTAFRQRGAREALIVASAAIAAATLVVVPFVVVSPGGTWDALRVQFRGGLQIETLASSVLVMTGHAAEMLAHIGFPPPSHLTTQGAGHGLNRSDLVGAGVGVTKTVMNVALAVALLLLWVSAARSRHDPREDLLRYATASVATLMVLGTVLSPQYVVWLIPLVPLVGGRRGLVAMVLFVVAGALTNVWIPDQYFEFQDSLLAGQGTLLLARNLALLAIVIVLVLPADVLQRSRRMRRPRTGRGPQASRS